MSEKSKKQIYQVADFISRTDQSRHLAVWKYQDNCICLVSPKESETVEDIAHAELIADAFNTFESSGLIPSMILKQRNELLEILDKVVKNHDASIVSLKEAVILSGKINEAIYP